MPVVAMTREMGSLGSVIAQEVTQRLGCESRRNDILGDAAREYWVRRHEATRQIAAHDEGVPARMRQMFDVDWTDPLLYDLVINTGMSA